MRKYLLRLERQGKALTPQQQAVLDKINTPKKVDSDSDSDSDDDWSSLCKETRESDLRNGIMIPSPIVKPETDDDDSSEDDGWISPRQLVMKVTTPTINEKKTNKSKKKRKKKKKKKDEKKQQQQQQREEKRGDEEKRQEKKTKSTQRREKKRDKKKKDSSLLTKRVFASLRELCSKDPRYSIDRFDDRVLKKLSLAPENVALNSIDTLRKYSADSIHNPSALLTKTLARLKREASSPSSRKSNNKKKSPKREPQKQIQNETTITSEFAPGFLTPKKHSNDSDDEVHHKVSIFRSRRGRKDRSKKKTNKS